MNQLKAVYSANGNIMGVFVLPSDLFKHSNYRNDAELRQSLSEWGQKNKVDSIMILGIDADSYKKHGVHFSMDVFEPWGIDDTEMSGTWSSMCGNGLMAVSLFYEDHVKKLNNGEQLYIQTRSGLRVSTKLGNSKYSIHMGEFTFQVNDLRPFVNIAPPQGATEWFQTPIPNSLPLSFCHNWSIGFSGDINEQIVGEPHVVMFRQESQKMTMNKLKSIAFQEGPLVTSNRALFPGEVSTSFAIVQDNNAAEKELSVIACTHERGLGDNVHRAVTGACGTGATSIAATLYRAYNLDDGYLINVRMPRGLLQVHRDQGQFYLIGRARKISKTKSHRGNLIKETA
jgi:diaminopimelate epimerase